MHVILRFSFIKRVVIKDLKQSKALINYRCVFIRVENINIDKIRLMGLAEIILFSSIEE